MKLPRFDTNFALTFGGLIAPLICALNWLVAELWLEGVHARLLEGAVNIGLSTLLLTLSLGWMTVRILEISQKGRLGQARGLSLGCGLFALVFWVWLATTARWRAPEIAAFALPCLWSIGFLLFAFFARPPRV